MGLGSGLAIDEVDEYIGDPDEVDEYIGEDGGGEHMGGSWDMHMGCGVDDIDNFLPEVREFIR